MSCDYCGKEITIKCLCEWCKFVRYCSPDCKRLDWFDTHNFFCPSKALNISNFLPQDDFLLHVPSGKLFDVVELEKDQKEEFRNYMRASHPQISKMYEIGEENNKLKLITEANSHSLADVLNTRLHEQQVWKYFTQICSGLFYLQTNNIPYNKVLIENMKLDEFDNIKISFLSTPSTTQKEFESLGLILHQLLHANTNTDENNELSKEVTSLLDVLMRSNSAISFEDILRHPWVTLHSPTMSASIGQAVYHEQLGNGAIIDIEGLLCCVAFGNCMLNICASDVYWTLDFPSVQRTMVRKTDKEEKLHKKLERFVKSNRKTVSVNERFSVDTFDRSTLVLSFSSKTEQFSGLLDADEIEHLIKNRPQIFTQKEFPLIFDHERADVHAKNNNANRNMLKKDNSHGKLMKSFDNIKKNQNNRRIRILDLFGCGSKR